MVHRSNYGHTINGHIGGCCCLGKVKQFSLDAGTTSERVGVVGSINGRRKEKRAREGKRREGKERKKETRRTRREGTRQTDRQTQTEPY